MAKIQPKLARRAEKSTPAPTAKPVFLHLKSMAIHAVAPKNGTHHTPLKAKSVTNDATDRAQGALGSLNGDASVIHIQKAQEAKHTKKIDP